MPVIKIEDHAPAIIPAINGMANSRIEATPIIYSTNTLIKVVTDVLMLLDNV